MARNINHVPKEKWKVWSSKARQSYNRVYDIIYSNQSLFKHPGMKPVNKTHWKTIAWNAAWIAADAVDDIIPMEIVEV